MDWMYVRSFFIFYIPMQSSFFARAWFNYKWENQQNCKSHKFAISDSNLTCDTIFENGFKWCFDWWKNKVNPTIILEITEGWSSFSHWHLALQITRLSRIPSYIFWNMAYLILKSTVSWGFKKILQSPECTLS